MKNKFLAVFAIVFLAASANAEILKTQSSDKSIEGVAIAKDGILDVDNQQTPVAILGAGLRSKKVAIVKVKVYVAELLSSDPSRFVRTDGDALNSLDQVGTAIVRLNFVRSVDAPKVQSSFVEALEANNVNIADADVAQFLEAVKTGGEATSGKALTIAMRKNIDHTESVYYEDTNGQVTKIVGTPGLSKKILSIWLGVPADKELGVLKENLIQGQ